MIPQAGCTKKILQLMDCMYIFLFLYNQANTSYIHVHSTNASLTCKVPHFEYKKVEGIPPWEDSGEAAIDIKNISFQVKIQTISEEYFGFSTQVLGCRCNIGHMDIHIKKSQYPE